MDTLTAAGLLAGLTLPLTAAAGGFRDAELWVDDFGFSGGWRPGRHPRLMGDVDGDGRADIVGFGEQGVVVSLSTGDGFTAPETWVRNYSFSNGWRIDRHPRVLADVDDDAMLDVIAFGNDGVYVSLSTGAEFRPPRLWATGYSVEAGWRVDRHPRLVVDVDADGRADIVAFGDDGVHVSRSTGASFGPPTLWIDEFGHDQGWRVDRHLRFLARVDADERLDIVGFGDDRVLVSRAGEGGFGAPEIWLEDLGADQGWRADRHVRLVGDVSGDGKDDLVGLGESGALLALARPDHYSPPRRAASDFGHAQGWRVDRHPRLLGDIDGDDRLDIVGFGQDGVVVATSRGDAFDRPRFTIGEFGYHQGWRVDQHVRTLADVNDDGALDIVGFGEVGVVVALADTGPPLPLRGP